MGCKPTDDAVDTAARIYNRFDSTSVHVHVYISPN